MTVRELVRLKLTPDDLQVMLEDFTLDAVTPAFRAALVARLGELG